jgi:two-component system LytT family response regulator
VAESAALSVLIADDERPARAKVRRFLERDADVGVIFEARDGAQALSVIRDQEPDVAFLDIQMPGLTGIDVAGALPADRMPHIVFVTAFHEFAVRAFELAAVDYLLKPFDAERFARALGRAKGAARVRSQEDDLQRVRRLLAEWRPEQRESLDRLAVEDGERTLLVSMADVDRLEAERNYVRLHSRGASYRVRATITELERRLDPQRFARVSRGTIVNLDRVAELLPAGHGDFEVRMRTGERLRLSRRYRDRLDRFRR